VVRSGLERARPSPAGGFRYSSDTNKVWLDLAQIQSFVEPYAASGGLEG
jgi:hypothetical protein